MTDIKTIFNTEVKQPKLGVVWWQNENRQEDHGPTMPYISAYMRANVLNALFSNDGVIVVHHWVEPVLTEEK